jgi:hypothetical protein
MSKEAVESVLGKALLDTEFRYLLLANPDQALAGFNLTITEKARLKKIDCETLEVLAHTLETRVKPIRLASDGRPNLINQGE